MVAKMSVPITLVKPCEMVSSCSIHSFCEVWMVSGDSVKALVQNSVHMVTNCCQACDGSGGCGAVAACDQKELLWCEKSCQNSRKLLGVDCGLMHCFPSFFCCTRVRPLSDAPMTRA